MKDNSKGFSLVETVLAIGIMGLAITALLGLLPHGIETTRQASQENAYARILDSVRAEILRLPFANVPTTMAAVERLSYDEQGNIRNSGDSSSFQAYIVEVDFRGIDNNPLTLSANVGGDTPQNLLYHFVIKIAATSLTDYSFEGRPANAFRTYSIYMGS
jgi:uncharacterized protein (TIGR02598 family)